MRARFLRRHPKSALYDDFGDFSFFRLEPGSASLNGGFGKAYILEPEDFLIASPAMDELAAIEESAIDHMNRDHVDAVSLFAQALAGERVGKWKICGIDAAGFDLASGDKLQRMEFGAPLEDANQLRSELSALAERARRT